VQAVVGGDAVPMSTVKKYTIMVASLLVLAAVLAWCAVLLYQHGYVDDVARFIDDDIPLPLFLGLMVCLPLVGFPISVFLIVAGIKYGIPAAFAFWLVVLPVHTMIGYMVAGSLRPLLITFFRRTLGYSIPTLRAASEARFSFLFLAIPGLPYAAKNYLLPLAGVSFRYSVVMNCIVQGSLGLPVIILGKAGMDGNLALFSVALLAVAALFLTLRWLKRRFSSS